MCGIAGIYNLTSRPAPEQRQLEGMITQLHHRGPDGYGYYTDDTIGLAHARLSIIDLEGGAQPIHNEDSSVWVVFNGEIFNFKELRADLERLGHVFYTHSDTEVIVHLYEQYGDDFAGHLNGQFSIALWDKPNRKLVLLRDRVGIAPLFYSEQDGRLVFASEVKAMLPAFAAAPELNPAALDQIMTFWAPVSPNSIFKGVNEVSPGEMIVFQDGNRKSWRYWDWLYPEDNYYLPGSEDELAGQLHDLLIEAARIRLRSDVPVGAYLSGGLDSSVLVSILRNHSDVSLRTFSIGFDEGDFDEASFQNMLIKHLNADHSRIQCSNEDIGNTFLDTIWHTESPILRTAPVPMRRLSGHVHDQHYKVVLTGEGADEVLGGYDIFKEGKIRQFWARYPDSEIRPLLLKRLYPYLDITKASAQSYLRAFFGAELEKPYLPYFAHIPRWNTTAKVKEFFSDDLKSHLAGNAIEILENSLPKAIDNWHPFNKSQYIEAKALMGGYLLCSQGDRMLMSNSVEGRFPFLDHRVIEFANRLHPKFKMKALNEKYLLKRAFNKYLPGQIVKRYKQPYRAPDIPSFFGEREPDYVNELLSKQALDASGYFDSSKVERLVKKIRLGRAIGYKDNMALVGILSTQAWHHHFIENRAGVDACNTHTEKGKVLNNVS